MGERGTHPDEFGHFDRVQIMGRLRVVGAGERTSYERHLEAVVELARGYRELVKEGLVLDGDFQLDEAGQDLDEALRDLDEDDKKGTDAQDKGENNCYSN